MPATCPETDLESLARRAWVVDVLEGSTFVAGLVLLVVAFRWCLEHHADRIPWRRLRVWIPLTAASFAVALVAIVSSRWISHWQEIALLIILIPSIPALPVWLFLNPEVHPVAGSLASAACAWLFWWFAISWLETIAYVRRVESLNLTGRPPACRRFDRT